MVLPRGVLASRGSAQLSSVLPVDDNLTDACCGTAERCCLMLQAARKAFAGLAYKRFHHVPLYLEYAPKRVFTAAAMEPGPKQAAAGTAAMPAAPDAQAASAHGELQQHSEADDDAADSATLYVKNVSFSTTQDALRTLFDQGAAACGGMLRAVRVVMHTRPDGKAVPKGFAFAEFGSHDTARSVLAKLQGHRLDGHALQLELSTRKGLGVATTKVSPAIACMRCSCWHAKHK